MRFHLCVLKVNLTWKVLFYYFIFLQYFHIHFELSAITAISRTQKAFDSYCALEKPKKVSFINENCFVLHIFNFI